MASRLPTPGRNQSAVLTLGYEYRNVTEFVRLLRRERVDLLIDVRETAWSHKPGFSKSALSEAVAGVGIQYKHWSWAGNPKWLRSVAESHEECLLLYREYLENAADIVDAFVYEVARLVEDGVRVCLTCYERHPGDCHRGILAEYWLDRTGVQVHHIEPDGRPRLTSAH